MSFAVEKLAQRAPGGMGEYRSYERMKGEFSAVPSSRKENLIT